MSIDIAPTVALAPVSTPLHTGWTLNAASGPVPDAFALPDAVPALTCSPPT